MALSKNTQCEALPVGPGPAMLRSSLLLHNFDTDTDML